MDDNKLSKLLSNALDMKRKQKMEENAERVIEAVQEEWQKRGISHAPVVNYLGYLYYQAGEKEKSKTSFES